MDSDGDGIPDGCDDCDNNLIGTPCDDQDPTTIADVIQANCTCAGQPPALEKQYWLEAECASLGAHWSVTEDVRASQSEAVECPEQTVTFADAPPLDAAFAIRFKVEVATEGSYELFARLRAVEVESDALWVRVNGGSWINWNKIDLPAGGTSFTWRQVGNWTGGEASIPITFFFNANTNIVEVVYQESGIVLDKILVASDTSLPTGRGAAAVECSTTSARDIQVQSFGRLFPNPTRELVTLAELPVPAANLVLTDVWGRLLRRFPDEPVRQRTLDLSGLPNGVYFLRARVGTHIGVWRVVLH